MKYVEQAYEFGKDDPGTPEPGIMQVFYENGVPTMVDFRCPCGCGSTCPTHLGLPTPKHWQFSRGPNGPTLSPSIRFLSGCKAHFTITDGEVTIHGDSGK